MVVVAAAELSLAIRGRRYVESELGSRAASSPSHNKPMATRPQGRGGAGRGGDQQGHPFPISLVLRKQQACYDAEPVSAVHKPSIELTGQLHCVGVQLWLGDKTEMPIIL